MENPVVAGVLVALVVPFLGNTLGAALVLFARHGMSERFTKALLGFAAGAMMYVVTEELIPQTQQGHHTNIGTIGVAFGFVLMMVLDVALG